MFPSMSWPLSQHGVEHAAKSLYLSLYCGHLSFNARLKCINCVRYRSPVIVSVGFNSYIIHYAELVPPNTEHDLGVNIRFGRRRGSMVGNSPWFSALGIIVMNLFFVPSHNAIQKSLPSLPFKQLFTSKRRSTSLGFNSYGTQFPCF